jgi:hypothetical protein
VLELPIATGHRSQIASVHILRHTPNVHSTHLYRLIASDSYTITAESRLVDGVLYVNAERDAEDDAELDKMPEGWVQIENIDDWPALEGLGLETYLEAPYSWKLFDDMDVPYLDPSEVWEESDTLENGTPVDVVTIIQKGEELKTALQGDEYVLDDSSVITITITINQNNEIVQHDRVSRIMRTKVEEHGTGGGKSIMKWITIDSISIHIGDINESREPVEVPEI